MLFVFKFHYFSPCTHTHTRTGYKEFYNTGISIIPPKLIPCSIANNSWLLKLISSTPLSKSHDHDIFGGEISQVLERITNLSTSNQNKPLSLIIRERLELLGS